MTSYSCSSKVRIILHGVLIQCHSVNLQINNSLCSPGKPVGVVILQIRSSFPSLSYLPSEPSSTSFLTPHHKSLGFGLPSARVTPGDNTHNPYPDRPTDKVTCCDRKSLLATAKQGDNISKLEGLQLHKLPRGFELMNIVTAFIANGAPFSRKLVKIPKFDIQKSFQYNPTE